MSPIEIFTTLGQRLATFGHDAATREVMRLAIENNGWFEEGDIMRAVEAIRLKMLDKEQLTRWLSDYPAPTNSPRRVAVIMAGNIPLVGFFDLMCVVVSGHECYVKPSSKDTHLMRFIIDELKSIDSSLRIFDYSADDNYDMVIATGGDEANRYFSEHFNGCKRVLRGSRHSVAVLTGEEDEATLKALQRDITAYSGLGCRSVSMIFLPEGHTPQLPITKAPNAKLERNIRQMRALLTMQQREFIDCGAFLLIEGHDFPTSLATVTLRHYRNIEEAEEWITSNRDKIQCVVSSTQTEGHIAPGEAQYPTLWDYADGVDTMHFLLD